MGGGLAYRATEALSLNLNVDRSTQESTFGDSAIYVTTGASLSAEYRRGKLGLNARVGGGFNDYPTKQTVATKTDWREDLYYAAGAGADYDIQPWLRVGLEYLFTGRDSNFQLFDFADHRVAVKATLQF
jgi:hypothetical protein